MRALSLLSASLLATAMSLPLAAAAHANIAISIDKSTQRMAVSVDGQQRYVWPVSTGRAGYETPSGNFRINRMDADHHSKEYDDAFMPDSMFFDLDGHAIHGFNDVPHLGMAVSHGCVRLSPANAATLFNLVKQEGMANVSVQIGGHIPHSPLVASRQAPQEVANAPTQIEPGYYRQQQPQYSYQPPAPQYQGQPYQGQQDQSQQNQGQTYQGRQYSNQQQYSDQQYAERQSLFPPQPQPYGQPAYGQRYYGGQGYGQGYYAQPGYGAPAYRQW